MLKVFEERTMGQDEGLMRDLDELAREGARRMLAETLELEVEAYLAKYVEFRDEHGHALVVRNGKARPRSGPNRNSPRRARSAARRPQLHPGGAH